jgi:hypothetical protein
MRALAVVALLLSACGDQAFILLEVVSTLEIPTDVDRLELEVYDQTTGVRLLQRERTLVEGDQFPYTVSLETDGDTPRNLRFQVRAYSGDTVVAAGVVTARWKRDSTNVVEVVLSS